MEKASNCVVKSNKSSHDDEKEDYSDDVFGLETSSYDLSQDFSDYSACSSDISGELSIIIFSSSPYLRLNG